MIRGTVDSRHENLEDTIDCREGVYARCVGAHAMRLGVLPGLHVYMNVSDSGTNSNILRHTYQRIQVAT